MNHYKSLNNQVLQKDNYKIIPIRFEDKMAIMKWRNKQIYHLRQSKLLTLNDQEDYFNNIVKPLFEKDKPDQILFSFLKNDICVGYGGLVHINWLDKNAEISFIMNTESEKKFFKEYWLTFLHLIEQVAFKDLKFHKIFTYAFDLRPNLYSVLNLADFNQDARLNDHCLFNGKYIDIVIHSKINLNC